jgi:hypothetical protein
MELFFPRLNQTTGHREKNHAKTGKCQTSSLCPFRVSGIVFPSAAYITGHREKNHAKWGKAKRLLFARFAKNATYDSPFILIYNLFLPFEVYHTSLSSLSLSGTASMNPASLDLADENSSFEIDSQSSGKNLTAIMIYVFHLSIQKVSTVEKTMGFLNFTTCRKSLLFLINVLRSLGVACECFVCSSVYKLLP